MLQIVQLYVTNRTAICRKSCSYMLRIVQLYVANRAAICCKSCTYYATNYALCIMNYALSTVHYALTEVHFCEEINLLEHDNFLRFLSVVAA